MDFRIISTSILLLFCVVVPLLPKPELLASWPVITVALFGVLLNVTQPAMLPKHLTGENRKDRRSVLAILIAGSLSFLIPILDYGYGRQARPPVEACWSIAGLVLLAGGLAFRTWAIRTLGRFFTAAVEVQQDQKVIQTGPFRFIRHPSYLGTVILIVGVPVLLRSYVGLVASIVLFAFAYALRISAEEKALAEELGAAYVDYQKRTWRLIPFVY